MSDSKSNEPKEGNSQNNAKVVKIKLTSYRTQSLKGLIYFDQTVGCKLFFKKFLDNFLQC